jgi:ketosteroid isomerase-like protein
MFLPKEVRMKADKKTEGQVMKALEQFFNAYSGGDMKGVLEHFIPDEDIIAIGTGRDEKRIGLHAIKAQIERDWEQSQDISVELGWHSVSSAGAPSPTPGPSLPTPSKEGMGSNVAWVAGDCFYHAKVGGEKIEMPCRFTAVLEKRKNKWLIAQWHLSMPYPGQERGESFPEAQAQEELFFD